MTTPRRVHAEARGRKGEQIAAWWLRLKGYRILGQRLKTRVGEIDLVAQRGKTIVFVEVKVRATVEDAVLAVSPKQRLRIVRAAEGFLAQRPAFADHDVRFDLIVIGGGLPKHMKGAWRAGD